MKIEITNETGWGACLVSFNGKNFNETQHLTLYIGDRHYDIDVYRSEDRDIELSISDMHLHYQLSKTGHHIYNFKTECNINFFVYDFVCSMECRLCDKYNENPEPYTDMRDNKKEICDVLYYYIDEYVNR